MADEAADSEVARAERQAKMEAAAEGAEPAEGGEPAGAAQEPSPEQAAEPEVDPEAAALAVMQATIAKLSQDEIEQYTAAFIKIDVDKGGTVDAEELQALMAQLGQEKKLEDIRKMLDEVDADGSGEIEVEEFLVLMVNYVGPQGEAKDEEVEEAFRLMDADGGGTIDKDELGDCLKELGEEMAVDEIAACIQMVDKQGTGEISLTDFKSAFAANAQAKYCATQIVRSLAGLTPVPSTLINTCYSLARPDYGFSVAGVYKPATDSWLQVEGAGGISPLAKSAGLRVQQPPAKSAGEWRGAEAPHGVCGCVGEWVGG